jgi:WD40-like Beta Propeller Repeat
MGTHNDSEAVGAHTKSLNYGKSIAFVSTRDGDADIFIMPLRPHGPPAEKEAINLTRHPGGDFNPAFSPDGKWIVFASERGGLNDEEPLIPVQPPALRRDLRIAPGRRLHGPADSQQVGRRSAELGNTSMKRAGEME